MVTIGPYHSRLIRFSTSYKDVGLANPLLRMRHVRPQQRFQITMVATSGTKHMDQEFFLMEGHKRVN